MEFRILFYKDNRNNNPIEEFLIEQAKSNRILVAKTRQGINKLRNKAYHKEPLSKHVESDLWELRIKSGNDILRIFYTFKKEQIIILLHIFVKKKQKTPIRELEIARKRLNEMKVKEAN